MATSVIEAAFRILLLLNCYSACVAGWECTNIPTQAEIGSRTHDILSSLNHYEATEAAIAGIASSNGQARRSMLQTGDDGIERGAVKGKYLEPVSLHDVRLLPSSPAWDAQQANLQYLLMLDADRMLWSFRKVAAESAGSEDKPEGEPYGGWESPGSELRGHFVGHYLSASAMAWASTHNASLREKMEYLVSELDRCQQRIGSGYLSAFPSELFDRFEAIQPVWAPYYTVHKIMAGLLDQYLWAGSKKALRMLEWMADYFRRRVQRVIAKWTITHHWATLNEEYGGMNDLLYQLYTVTGDERHLHLARLFDKPCFLGPLALKDDDLDGLHSNAHIPIVVGAQARFEVVGDSIYQDIGRFFLHLINSSHSFTSGGTSSWEFWHPPHRLGTELAQEDQESCTTYNLLKVSRNLFRTTREVRFSDYYERAFVNGVMGIQRGTEPGVMIYMLPHGPGESKARGYHGWGNPFDSFWCCYGTGIESFSKLADSIFFASHTTEGPELVISHFLPSEASWKAAGVAVRMEITPPTAASSTLRVSIEIVEKARTDRGDHTLQNAWTVATDGAADVPADVATSEGTESHREEQLRRAVGVLSVRVPSWSLPPCKAELNGESITCSPPGTLLRVPRHWSIGDKLSLSFCMSLRMESIQDDRKEYSSLSSFLLGPNLLVGLTTGDNKLSSTFDASVPANHVQPIPLSANQQLISLLLRSSHRSDASEPLGTHERPSVEGKEQTLQSSIKKETSGTVPSAEVGASDPPGRRVVACHAGSRDMQLLSATCGYPPRGTGGGKVAKTVDELEGREREGEEEEEKEEAEEEEEEGRPWEDPSFKPVEDVGRGEGARILGSGNRGGDSIGEHAVQHHGVGVLSEGEEARQGTDAAMAATFRVRAAFAARRSSFEPLGAEKVKVESNRDLESLERSRAARKVLAESGRSIGEEEMHSQGRAAKREGVRGDTWQEEREARWTWEGGLEGLVGLDGGFSLELFDRPGKYLCAVASNNRDSNEGGDCDCKGAERVDKAQWEGQENAAREGTGGQQGQEGLGTQGEQEGGEDGEGEGNGRRFWRLQVVAVDSHWRGGDASRHPGMGADEKQEEGGRGDIAPSLSPSARVSAAASASASAAASAAPLFCNFQARRVTERAIALAFRPNGGMLPATAVAAVSNCHGGIAFMQHLDAEQHSGHQKSSFVSQSGTTTSVLREAVSDEAFGADIAWLEIQPGIARYADLSFVAEGESRNFLLQPIASLIDESYSSYFNITLPEV